MRGGSKYFAPFLVVLGLLSIGQQVQQYRGPLEDLLMAAKALAPGRLFLLSNQPLSPSLILSLEEVAAKHDSFVILPECLPSLSSKTEVYQLPSRAGASAVFFLVLSPTGGILASGTSTGDLEALLSVRPLPDSLWSVSAQPALDALKAAGRGCP